MKWLRITDWTVVRLGSLLLQAEVIGTAGARKKCLSTFTPIVLILSVQLFHGINVNFDEETAEANAAAISA